MARVIIFGVADFASLAHFYLRHDSPHEVVGFTVSEQYLPDSGVFEGVPVVDFAAVDRVFPPADHKMFAPMSSRGMNRLRESVYRQALEKGYELISYVSSKATIFPGTPVGANCFILEDNTIQPYTRIGDDVVLWSGNHIGHHTVIGDHVFVTSHVVLSGHCVVEPFAFLGVNATVRDGIRIGEGSLVAMAAAITADTDPWGIYQGNPARKRDVASTDIDF